MKKTLLILFLLCTLNSIAVPGDAVLNPCPQRVENTGKTFYLPATFRLIGNEKNIPHAVNSLRQLLGGRISGEGLPVYIGDRNDKAIQKFRRHIPEQAEAYYLEISSNRIVLAGSDKRGTFYAVQTLKQLLTEGLPPDSLRSRLSTVKITDFPDVPVRGVVEGFYGTPWSQEARLSQLDFYGANKLNTYIFGPKNDPYHSTPKWRIPYPEKEAGQIRLLIEKANENEVDFVWAIHPGRDIQWNDTDRIHIINKFEHMYKLGVRSFAVFFDDISGRGTQASNQVELLNYLNEHFIRKKADARPLIMCPTEYNRSRWKPEKNYLATLGSGLDPSIRIMWTGDRALSDITSDNLHWINGIIQRKPYIWWNFPVTDFANDRLLMGEVYGIDDCIRTHVSAFVANPMQYAEASKIALYSVANRTWNTQAYDAAQTWRNAIRAAVPDAPGAMECFCANSSDTGEGHYRRKESEYLSPLVESLNESYVQGNRFVATEFDSLRQRFNEMAIAADQLLTSGSNPPLLKEIRPWLLYFSILAQTGQSVVTLAEAAEQGDSLRFEQTYLHIKALQIHAGEINRNIRRVKAGSAIVFPTIQSLFSTATRKFNARFGTARAESVWPEKK